MSAHSHKRTSSGASKVQNRVYGKPPLRPLLQSEFFCCSQSSGNRKGCNTVHALWVTVSLPSASIFDAAKNKD